jgi:hypothetical protein
VVAAGLAPWGMLLPVGGTTGIYEVLFWLGVAVTVVGSHGRRS